MSGTDIRSLLGKLNSLCTRILDQAAGFCLTRTHYQIAVEHFLLQAMEGGSGDIPAILQHFEVELPRLQKELLRTVDDFASGNPSRPTFSPQFLALLEQAWLLASVNLGASELRSGHLLLALVRDAALLSAREYGRTLLRVESAELERDFYKITRGSVEERPAPVLGRAAPGAAGAPAAGGFLAAYTRDVTQAAREGKIDPVFGRDREIREMIDILARRRKNNPIAVGEPGVGKTAVVEGLALRIVEGDVPDILKNVTLRTLDMGLLQAGAGVKGEFENRLKGVIEEVKASPVPIILFIDEAHTLIGSGGPAGGSDAANLLKPALARGELRTIAATTWTEYKKYFEKDAALARRFQMVKLGEPSVEQTIDILRGTKKIYEDSHGITILDQAVVESARLAGRYLSGRQLPDKAFDLLDTACARVKISLSSTPPVLDDLARRLAAVERTINALQGERRLSEEGREELEKARRERDALAAERDRLVAQRAKESTLVEKIRAALVAGKTDEEEALRAELKAIQGDRPLVKFEVDAEAVASVVTDWTGIPLSRMLADEADTILRLEELLKARIKGQDWAMETIAKGIRSAKSGVKAPETPIGVFLLVGPSGVGKTETGLALADLLFGGERFMITINMSEFQERHTVSRLIGSPPGYVGYGEGGRLTEALRQRPYSVVLLDETEKAHPDVLNLFYQVFDKGSLSDGEGRQIDCRNALFILTSNLATDTITKLCESPVRPEVTEVLEAIRPEVSKWFKPALLARMNLVPFMTLPEETIKEIVVLKLGKLVRRLQEAHRIALEYGPEVVDAVAARCTEVETGARNIDYILQQNVMPRISVEILAAMARGEKRRRLRIGYSDADGFSFAWDQA